MTDRISPAADEPFISAGVVQVEPSDEVAYTAEVPSVPTATNKPDELTVTSYITAAADDPFIRAGVVQVEPLDDVA